jgi:hypothetical protein
MMATLVGSGLGNDWAIASVNSPFNQARQFNASAVLPEEPKDMQSQRINCGQASRPSESINSNKPGLPYLPARSLPGRTSTSKHLFLRFIREAG